MATVADRYTDKTFSQLESRISKMYREAQRDLKNKLADFTRHHKAKDAEMRKKLRSGEITQAQYQQWMTGQVFVGKQWEQKIEQVNSSIKNVMQEASNLTHGKSMDVFAENANYTAYQLEKDLKANINFGLYDTSTVSRLVGKDPEILPRRVVNGRKLDAWETKKISNAISQGIIQGEGIDQIASRIARDTCIAADHSSVMYARTAMTAAQNAGRMERLHEAEEMGIRVQKKWMAILDNRTRDSHADLDGEVVDVDETFSNGLMYPGDPSTNDFAEICNCRCTMVYVYPDFKQSFERSAFLGYDENGHKQYETIKDMTYREWQQSKQPVEPVVAQSPAHKVVDGKDITETWQRRTDKFEFEIDDVIEAQEFNGLPSQVSDDDFNKAVEESGIIMKRGYRAPDEETLEFYHQQLVGGKWYVDCSNGGAAFGQGMYAVGSYGNELTPHMQSTVEGYGQMGKIETFTMKSPSIINSKDIGGERWRAIYEVRRSAVDISLTENQETLFKLMSNCPMSDQERSAAFALFGNAEDAKTVSELTTRVVNIERVKNKTDMILSMDDGVFSAMRGYDAIQVDIDGEGGKYFVVLNRTKCIFKR